MRRVVHGHLHRSYVRRLDAFTLANAGSVSLSYDGDPRAAYAVVSDETIAIRRVEYDIEGEVRALFEARDPDAPWIAAMLRTGTYVPPPAE
jgi:predicted metal-dependent enzyme (double-stranded beta helix superfamily)